VLIVFFSLLHYIKIYIDKIKGKKKKGINEMKKVNVPVMFILIAFFIVVTTSLSSATYEDWLCTGGNRIYDIYGNDVWITGINWFGFETDTNLFHGLWCRDLESVLMQVADNGFNVLRVPMNEALVKTYIDGGRVSPGGITIDKSSNHPINAYLDGMDSLQILDYAINFCERIGLKIILDIHSIEPNSYQEGLWYNNNYNFQDFINAWKFLANRYNNNDTVIGFDLKNEPHGKFNEEPNQIAKWDSSMDPNNWKRAAEIAANEIHSINPRVLIFIEGVESYRDAGVPNIREKLNLPIPDNTDLTIHTSWWGGNLMGVRYDPIYIQFPQQFVYSPHEYGPNVHIQPWFEKNFSRADLEIVWRHYWFFIHESNIVPIHIGEWGGKIEGPGNEDNLKWMTAFRDFIVEHRLNHTFWCLNQDSGDTGGLLIGSNWEDFDNNKYNFIKPTLWQNASGKFVGLDHDVQLGQNGMTIFENINGNQTPPPFYTPYPTQYPTSPPYPTEPGYPTPAPTGPEYPRNGDVNSDGRVNIVDALLIARFAVKLHPPMFNTSVADVNYNGNINIIDSLLVARASVGLIQL
jgi:endoglucanase